GAALQQKGALPSFSGFFTTLFILFSRLHQNIPFPALNLAALRMGLWTLNLGLGLVLNVKERARTPHRESKAKSPRPRPKRRLGAWPCVNWTIRRAPHARLPSFINTRIRAYLTPACNCIFLAPLSTSGDRAL